MRLKHLFLPLILLPCYALADGRVLHFSNYSLNLQNSCSTDHKLNVQIGNELYCAPLTTDWSDDSLHVSFGGTTYTVCNGECGGGEWVMPEEPGDPIVITDPTCEWTQTNPNAYLLSDGNQYFDTQLPVDTSWNIDITAQVINGKHARIYGSQSSTCHFDFTMNKNNYGVSRIGSSNSTQSVLFTAAQSKLKTRYYSETVSNGKKIYVQNSQKSSWMTHTGNISCTDLNNTWRVFDNNLINAANIDPSQSGGIKLYYIRLYDSSGNLIHDFQPVAQGTNICGTVAATNAMWDFVTKKLYYPGGTGTMGYGVDQ